MAHAAMAHAAMAHAVVAHTAMAHAVVAHTVVGGGCRAWQRLGRMARMAPRAGMPCAAPGTGGDAVCGAGDGWGCGGRRLVRVWDGGELRRDRRASRGLPGCGLLSRRRSGAELSLRLSGSPLLEIYC